MNIIQKMLGRFINIGKLAWTHAYFDDFVQLKTNRKLNLENEEEQNLYYSLKTNGFIDDDYQIIFEIKYEDIYRFYYAQDEMETTRLNFNEPINDYRYFGLPDLYDSTLDLKNEGNYLIDESVRYAYEFEGNNYRREGKSAVLFDKNALNSESSYRIMPPSMFELVKEIDSYNSQDKLITNIAEQFTLLSKIKEYESDVALTICPRLKDEPKPVIIDKISIDIMDDGESLSIVPKFSEDGITNSLLQQNCYISEKVKDFYSPSQGPQKGVKFVVRHKEILEKLRNEYSNVKGDERLQILKNKELIFADWAEDIEEKIDLSEYSDRVVGIGYLDYKKDMSFENPTNLNWSETDKTYDFPALITGEVKITLHPEKHLEYFESKIAELKKNNKENIEIEMQADTGEIYKAVMSVEDLESEKRKIENSIISPEKITNEKILEEIISNYSDYKDSSYIPLNNKGVYLRNFDGKERLEQCLANLAAKKQERKLNKEEEKTSNQKTFLIKENEDELEYSEMEKQEQGEGNLSFHAEIPSALREEYPLMDHQRDALKRLQEIWLAPASRKGFMLCDDMGLGKTLQLLSFLAWLKEKRVEYLDALIVAPGILLQNWKDEIEKFFKPKSFKVRILNSKLKNISELNEIDIVLMTYTRLRMDNLELGKKKWTVFICDEAQFIKEPKTLVTVASKAQQSEFKIVCTATPIENSLKDLWNLVDFCRPGLLGYLKEFKEKFISPLNDPSQENKQKINESLKDNLDSLFLRREKDLLKKLPQKNIIVYRIRANEQEKNRVELYYRLGSVSMGKLKEMIWSCANPNLKVEKEKNHIESNKLAVLGKILNQIKDKNEKVVVFVESKEIQKQVAKFIFGSYNLKVDIINGDSKGNRKDLLENFKGVSGFNIIILSPLVAGFGITVTEANHVIHYTRMWNPAKEDQATDRVYRIGQDKNVTVHLPILTFGKDETVQYSDVTDWIENTEKHLLINRDQIYTPEEKLNVLLARKKKMLLDFFFAGSQDALANISMEEFSELNKGKEFIEAYITYEHLENEQIKGHLFESLVACIYEKEGYKTFLTPRSNDHGIDVIAINKASSEALLIQCKSGKPNCKEIREKMNKGITEKYRSEVADYKIIKIIASPEIEDKYYKDIKILNKAALSDLLEKHKLLYSEIEKRDIERSFYIDK